MLSTYFQFQILDNYFQDGTSSAIKRSFNKRHFHENYKQNVEIEASN